MSPHALGKPGEGLHIKNGGDPISRSGEDYPLHLGVTEAGGGADGPSLGARASRRMLEVLDLGVWESGIRHMPSLHPLSQIYVGPAHEILHEKHRLFGEAHSFCGLGVFAC